MANYKVLNNYDNNQDKICIYEYILKYLVTDNNISNTTPQSPDVVLRPLLVILRQEMAVSDEAVAGLHPRRC